MDKNIGYTLGIEITKQIFQRTKLSETAHVQNMYMNCRVWLTNLLLPGQPP